ncbi:LD-carboxypeptidase [Granulicella sp. WH15]|nr:LD-carboxypeptidase [Granulicella sp. WH15]
MKKPKALKAGARVAVVSPASAARAELVETGMQHLRELGYAPVLFPSALARGPLYYAGTAEQRVADLHAAFADPSIDAILCTRGGWGSAELLPLLDAELIRAHAKPFVGYSDHTSLHIWLQQVTGMVTFYGPMVAADFSRPDGAEMTSWQNALAGAESWSLGSEQGLRALRPGTTEGVFTGGCLSIFAEALGTPYAPVMKDSILFLEDVGTKPYQWDRMLLHLRYAGVLDEVRGIVFGDMRQCCAPEEDALLESALLHALRDFKGPIAIGLKSGHVSEGNVTVPLGIRARLDLKSVAGPRVEFLEAAVTV